MIKFELSVSEKTGRQKEVTSNPQQLTAETALFFIEEIQRALIFLANDSFNEERQKGNFQGQTKVFVDGSINKPVSKVKAFGKIEFVDASSLDVKKVLVETFERILNLSPVDTGQYFSSHVVVYNSQVVASDMAGLKSFLERTTLSPGDIIRFINSAPYARKLERYGVTKGNRRPRRVKSRDKQQRSGQTILTPNGTYFLAWKSTYRKYGKFRKVSFSFLPGSSLGLAANYRSKKNLRGRRERESGQGRTYLYPTITIIL